MLTKTLMSVLIISSFGVIDVVCAGPPAGAGKSYPLVYGATGRPYGPTQSHYQYQLRYGRPWHGGGGSRSYYAGSRYSGSAYYPAYYHAGVPPIYGLNVPVYAGSNFIYTGPVYPQYGAYGYFGEIPGVPTINHVPYQIGSTGNTMIGRGFQPDPFEFPLNQPGPVDRVIEESTPQQREQALRLRVQGDEAFARMDYRRAGDFYDEATDIAPDDADSRYRLAISLAARSRFDEAVEQLKIATQIDMDWPLRGVTLDQLFGLQEPDDWMKRDEKNRVKTRIAEWTNRDVRDPNRLFLLAAVMMLDGDVRAKGLLETAVRLNGVERHLVAFLRPLVDSEVHGESPPDAAVKPRVFELDAVQPGFVPPSPEPNVNRGEITGEERQRRVFEKQPSTPSESLIPPLPNDVDKVQTAKPPAPNEPDAVQSNSESPSDGPVLPPRP